MLGEALKEAMHPPLNAIRRGPPYARDWHPPGGRLPGGQACHEPSPEKACLFRMALKKHAYFGTRALIKSLA